MENKRLTIKNYKKIRGLCYYDDGSWLPLYPTSVRGGGRAHIDLIEETEMCYRLRLIYIQPQPESAIITIWRDSTEVVGTSLYSVEIHKGKITIAAELWDSTQFGMDKLLKAIHTHLIK